MPCELLVLAPHPDDAELHCGATIARHTRRGQRVVVVDATRGELGSRGSVDQRRQEATAAAECLGLHARENLGLPDGAVDADPLATRIALVAAIRRHKPATIACLSGIARHPDHIALAAAAPGAVKAAALHLFSPESGAAWRCPRLVFYEAELPLSPTLLLPATESDWETKQRAIRCYASQFGLDGQDGPATSITEAGFLDWIDARGRTWGQHAGAPFAEAFVSAEPWTLSQLA